MRSSATSTIVSISASLAASPLPFAPSPPFRRLSSASSAWRFASMRTVRVVVEHPARQVAADRFEDVIRNAHLGKLGDDRVAQIVEPEPVEACFVAESAPSRVPLPHRLGAVVASPLAERSRETGPSNSRSAKRSMHCAMSASRFAAAVGFRSLR